MMLPFKWDAIYKYITPNKMAVIQLEVAQLF